MPTSRWLAGLDARLAARSDAPCVHVVRAVVLLETGLRGPGARAWERAALALNLVAWALVPAVPLRNLTVGPAQVAVAHSAHLAGRFERRGRWLRPDPMPPSARWRLVRALGLESSWHFDAVADLLSGLRCRGRPAGALAAEVARRYNPHHRRYAANWARALAAVRERIPDGPGCRA